MREPLMRQRQVLAEVCAKLDVAAVAFSPAVMGARRTLYEAALVAGHEGVKAKHLRSVYRPGQRSVTWKRINSPTRRQCLQRDICSH
jgi:ATP-dependent DNA ligase